MFDVRHELAYKEYRFEFQLLLSYLLLPLSIWHGDLISCQTSRTTEIIFSLTLALSHMRFQFMSCYVEYSRSRNYH
ncbi:shikimate kinase [Lelliottia amnigena]|nr:shikimate kinase [Lelliottia amnigena]